MAKSKIAKIKEEMKWQKVLPAVSFSDFLKVVEIASSVMACKTSNLTVKRGIGIHIEDIGQTITLTDTPLNHIGVTIAQTFSDDPGKFQSLIMRYMAMERVFSDQRCADYIRKTEDEDFNEIHPGVFLVASCLPLDKDGHYDLDQFFACVNYAAQNVFFEEGNSLALEKEIVKSILAVDFAPYQESDDD